MISALEIGIALSSTLLVLAYVLAQPKPQPIRVRAKNGTRDAGRRHGPRA